MANPITWKTIAAPSFAASNDLFQSSSKGLVDSFDSFVSLADKMGQQKDERMAQARTQLTQQLLNEISSQGVKGFDEYQNQMYDYLGELTPEQIDMAAIRNGLTNKKAIFDEANTKKRNDLLVGLRDNLVRKTKNQEDLFTAADALAQEHKLTNTEKNALTSGIDDAWISARKLTKRQNDLIAQVKTSGANQIAALDAEASRLTNLQTNLPQEVYANWTDTTNTVGSVIEDIAGKSGQGGFWQWLEKQATGDIKGKGDGSKYASIALKNATDALIDRANNTTKDDEATAKAKLQLADLLSSRTPEAELFKANALKRAFSLIERDDENEWNPKTLENKLIDVFEEGMVFRGEQAKRKLQQDAILSQRADVSNSINSTLEAMLRTFNKERNDSL